MKTTYRGAQTKVDCTGGIANYKRPDYEAMVCHVGRAMRTIKIGGAKAESYCLVSEHIIAESLEHISFFSSTLSSKHQKSKQMVLPLVGGSLGRGYFSASETKTHRQRL